MTGTEIMAFLANNMEPVASVVGPVAGAIFTAIFLRNNTATKEFEKVKAGKLQEVADDLLESGRMTYTEYYKAKNFLQVAKKADEEYKKAPHEEKTSGYNFDWFIRFYEAVGNISNEEMQRIWAKILAGEIRHSNTYSLRCIDVMKNISQSEADLFTKVCGYCICEGENIFFPNYDKYREDSNISFSEIMFLDELGLISSDSMLILHCPVSTEPKVFFTNGALLMTIKAMKETTTTFDVRQFPLTAVGKEISTLIGNSINDEDFIRVAEEVNESQEVVISVYKILEAQNNKYKCDKADLLVEEHETTRNSG